MKSMQLFLVSETISAWKVNVVKVVDVNSLSSPENVMFLPSDPHRSVLIEKIDAVR